MQTTVADREAARAQRIERREMISEGLGISVADLNSLLQMVRPDAEEPRQPNQPLRQELAGNP